jgi:hypothetical protein
MVVVPARQDENRFLGSLKGLLYKYGLSIEEDGSIYEIDGITFFWGRKAYKNNL